MSSGGILVIDDELQMRKLLEITLHSNGFRVLQEATAKEGMLTAVRDQPDLVILDLGLPDEDGQRVLSRLREWYSKPVIILSVLSGEEEIVQALDNGANDYLVKPFRTGELLARIRSALRSAAQEENDPIMQFRDFIFDLSSRMIRKNGEVLKLTATQYALFVLFGKNEGKVLTHQYILKQVWGPAFQDQLQYLRVFVAQLRKKIEKDANHPEYIVTESGIGYRFVAK